MTLRSRLALGFSLIALLLGVPLALSLRALSTSARTVERLRTQELAASMLVGQVRSTARELRDADRAVLFVPDSGESEKWMGDNGKRLVSLADSLDRFNLPTFTARLRHSGHTIGTYGPIEWAAAADSNPALADRVSAQHILPAIDAVERSAAEAEHLLAMRAQGAVIETSRDAREALQLAATLLAAALAGALVVAVWITRSISRPVRDLEAGMTAVADGDFDHTLTIAPSRHDEFGRLAASFRTMAAQLAELDKLKAEFVSVASHELKTPINVILGYLTLLEDQLYGPVTAKQLEVLATVENQAQTLSRLVQHLLDVSRFQAGAARLEPRPMSLHAFLTELEQTFDVLAMQGRVSFAIHVARDLPEVVTWDRDRMNEVLANLLANAFKFTESGGRVELTAAPTPDRTCVRLCVRDTGAGIAADQLAHIFEKFFQADNQSASAQKGSGLGLAIAREIVEAHGGAISVESTRGRGTAFSIVLPIVAGDPSPAIEPAHTARDDAPPRLRALPVGAGRA
ncbi:MAG: ATP-binding protein [Gemmatirosa sp.]